MSSGTPICGGLSSLGSTRYTCSRPPLHKQDHCKLDWQLIQQLAAGATLTPVVCSLGGSTSTEMNSTTQLAKVITATPAVQFRQDWQDGAGDEVQRHRALAAGQG